MNAAAPPFRFAAPRLAPGVLAAVVLAHLAVAVAVWLWPAAPVARRAPETIIVQLIEAPAANASVARPLPPAPAPSKPRPPAVRPSPLRAPAPAPEPPRTAPAPRPAEAIRTEPPRAEAAPAPTPAAPAVPTAPTAPASEPPRAAVAPTPLTQPRFNADYLDNPKPPYPSLSRRMGEEGEVRLRVQVDAAGNAQQVELQTSSGFPRLDQSALDTVRRWRFVPARQGDQPVPASVIVPIQFSLRS